MGPPRSPCCARSASGHVISAAPPSSVMNSRRHVGPPLPKSVYRALNLPYLIEVRFTPWLSLWRSSREILNHGCKSLRSDFHRAGERMIDDHNGQQPGKDQD